MAGKVDMTRRRKIRALQAKIDKAAEMLERAKVMKAQTRAELKTLRTRRK